MTPTIGALMCAMGLVFGAYTAAIDDDVELVKIVLSAIQVVLVYALMKQI